MRPLNKYSLIAPCGMNCGICMAYLREKNRCPGCRGEDAGKPITRINCKIKTCFFFQKRNRRFCFKCRNFPCGILKHLDKRYITKYKTSLIDNLIYIKKSGIKEFLEDEKSKWTCKCRGTICIHEGYCFSCGKIKEY